MLEVVTNVDRIAVQSSLGVPSKDNKYVSDASKEGKYSYSDRLITKNKIQKEIKTKS